MPEKQSLLKKKHFFTLTMTKDLSPFFWATFCLLILFSYQLMTMRRKWFLLDLSLFRGASNVPIAPIKLYIIWLVQFCQTIGWFSLSNYSTKYWHLKQNLSAQMPECGIASGFDPETSWLQANLANHSAAASGLCFWILFLLFF